MDDGTVLQLIAVVVIVSSLGATAASVSIVRWLRRLDRRNHHRHTGTG